MNIQKVWPLLPNVQDGPTAHGRFLLVPKSVDLDDPYWAARITDGSVCLHDPAPATLPAPSQE